jgi:hypothetical protein
VLREPTSRLDTLLPYAALLATGEGRYLSWVAAWSRSNSHKSFLGTASPGSCGQESRRKPSVATNDTSTDEFR